MTTPIYGTNIPLYSTIRGTALTNDIGEGTSSCVSLKVFREVLEGTFYAQEPFWLQVGVEIRNLALWDIQRRGILGL